MSCKSQEAYLILTIAEGVLKHLFIAEQWTTEYASDVQI